MSTIEKLRNRSRLAISRNWGNSATTARVYEFLLEE
jgi:hypothetical protein